MKYGGGVPAKFIKKRFDNNDITVQLEKSEWWNFTEEYLKSRVELLNSPEKFLDEINNNKK